MFIICGDVVLRSKTMHRRCKNAILRLLSENRKRFSEGGSVTHPYGVGVFSPGSLNSGGYFCEKL